MLLVIAIEWEGRQLCDRKWVISHRRTSSTRVAARPSQTGTEHGTARGGTHSHTEETHKRSSSARKPRRHPPLLASRRDGSSITARCSSQASGAVLPRARTKAIPLLDERPFLAKKAALVVNARKLSPTGTTAGHVEAVPPLKRQQRARSFARPLLPDGPENSRSATGEARTWPARDGLCEASPRRSTESNKKEKRFALTYLTADAARRPPPDRANSSTPRSRRKAVRSATCRPAATTSRRRHHHCRRCWEIHGTTTFSQATSTTTRHLSGSAYTPATDRMVVVVVSPPFGLSGDPARTKHS